MDKKLLEKFLEQYKAAAKPFSTDNSQPATIEDINKLVDETAKLISILNDLHQ